MIIFSKTLLLISHSIFSLDAGGDIEKKNKIDVQFGENENRSNLKRKEFGGNKLYIDFCRYVKNYGWCCFEDCYNTIEACHRLCPPQGKPP